MENQVGYCLLMSEFYAKRELKYDAFYLLNQAGRWLDKPELVDLFHDAGIEQKRLSGEELAAETERLRQKAGAFPAGENTGA